VKFSEPVMQDGNFRVDGLRGLNGGGIVQFAADVVARLVARDGGPGVVMREPLVLALLTAVRTSGLDAFDALKPDLRRARITREALADHYIPEVARRLGAEWECDRTSFADVSIGVARLQAILRTIGEGWSADDYVAGGAPKGGGTLLLILPPGEQHTLGAMVVAGWLRRKGISVCLRIGPSAADLEALLAVRNFDGAMISTGGYERLEVCAMLVKTLKNHSVNRVRVALGGSVLEHEENVAAATGADIVTNDLSAVIEAFGLARQRPLMTETT
jgi:MerR family transcriptional regulator, light-induced transcriptional regulator